MVFPRILTLRFFSKCNVQRATFGRFCSIEFRVCGEKVYALSLYYTFFTYFLWRLRIMLYLCKQ